MGAHEKANILLVDDQPARLLSYEAILAELDENLVSARSGTEALRRLMASEFAVILLDVNMPEMDGFETAALIRQHPRFERTPIIFVTAVHVTDLDRLRGYQLGAVDYVYVPVIPEILRSKVAVMVELYNKRRELQRLNQSLERANAELAEAHSALQAEKTRELQRLNATLEQANQELAGANQVLQEEIAERRRAEERMRFLAEMIPSMVWTAAPDGTLSYVNRRWLEYCCGSETLDPAAAWPELEVHPADAERHQAERALHLQQGTPFEVEARYRRHDGAYRWFITRAEPWRDAKDELVCWFGITTDIDDPKQLQEQLREADRLKDEFIAILGHELRNPLAPISNALGIMRRKQLHEPELVWARDVLSRQVEQLTRLVDDLLDVARITRGKIELRKQPIELATVVDRALEASRPLIDAGHHELTLSRRDASLVVLGDQTRLAQAVANLLNNASKYTPEGGSIHVSLAREEGLAVVRVRDSGCGIPPAMLTRIFEPFTQAIESRETAPGGLGIGLAVVRRLVEMHGGTVHATSAGSGTGAEFVLRLPLAVDAGGEAPTPAPRPAAELRARRVLVADDNQDAAESLALLLRLHGHEARVAHDGHEAVSVAEAFRPHVALLDIGMPGMDGYATARAIRDRMWGSAVLLVALTGWGQPEDRQRTLEAGFDEHRVKPVDCDDLLRLIADAPPEARAG